MNDQIITNVKWGLLMQMPSNVSDETKDSIMSMVDNVANEIILNIDNYGSTNDVAHKASLINVMVNKKHFGDNKQKIAVANLIRDEWYKF